MGRLWGTYGALMGHVCGICVALMGHLWGTYGALMGHLWGTYGARGWVTYGASAFSHLWGKRFSPPTRASTAGPPPQQLSVYALREGEFPMQLLCPYRNDFCVRFCSFWAQRAKLFMLRDAADPGFKVIE